MSSPHILADAPKVALIGGGFIGPVHAEALRRIGVPVVGMLGSSPARASEAAKRLGIALVYRDLDELLADSQVGSVHVASPNQAHFEQARRVLESGRHVVCEKPLATTSAQTSALRRLAESRPRQAAAVNYNIRFYPLCQEMRARIARGDIGRVLSVTGSYAQDWLLYPTDYNWRVEPDGGTNLRAVADIGTHWMDLAQFIVGHPIEAVLAELATFHTERHRPTSPTETFHGPAGPGKTEKVNISTDDHAAVLLRLAGGGRGAFHVSQVTAGRKNRLTLAIAGSDGSMAWDSESPDDLWIGHRDRPNEHLKRDPALLSAAAATTSHYPGGHAEGFPDTFKQLYLAIYGWIAADGKQGPPFPTFADGDREVRLCEAIAASAAKGAWVDVEAASSLQKQPSAG
ncbi:MAG TPA: Gfo/Idh/MocA family oxidoreductase [Isosphaeraceae bacterium]|jgi:predicted dehydrogenase|nr:Gfo/Idh/MocA family oxidoreductase [Isosphaeraceae bacterium]